jgi:multicomponent Na+:H+ antiporter subunit D
VNDGIMLQIVAPLVGAPLCLLLRSGRAAAVIAALVGFFLLANSILLQLAVRESGPLTYAFGGFEPPYGIEYRLDGVGAFFLVVISSVVALTTWWAAFGTRYEFLRRRDLFFALWLLCVAGSCGMVLSADAFNVFVFLEVSSLASYGLVAHGPRRWALVSAFRYLLAGTVGATFVLVGIGLLYSMTGTLNLEDLANRLPAVADSRTVRAGWAFIGVGLCLKAAVFPLHLWLPDAYSTAPSPVAALLGGIATKIAIVLWIRFFRVTFEPAAPLTTLLVDDALLLLGFAGVIVGAVVAASQRDPRRLLAWSSVSQVGYMIVGFALGSAAGLAATAAHVLHHALVKSAAFMALGHIAIRLGVTERRMDLDDLAGIGRRAPFVSGALVIAVAGLVGMPLTAGFIAKWLLLEELIAQERWVGVGALVLGSLLAAYYAWRLIEPMFFGKAPATSPSDSPIGRGMGIVLGLPVAIACGASIYFGIVTDFNIDVARDAALELFGRNR